MSTRRTLTRTIAAAAAAALVAPLALGAASATAVTKATYIPAYSVNVGSNPADVAVSQALGQAFVVNDGSVSVVSLLTHRQLAEVNSGGGTGQNGIALVKGGRQAYITNSSTNKVNVFDTETRKVTKQVDVGWGAVDVATVNAPFGQRAYVALRQTDQLAVIRTDKGTVTRHIKLPDIPQTVTAAPGGKYVWAGSADSGKVWVVRTNKPKVVKTVSVKKSGPVVGVAFTPSGKHAWVAGLGGVSVVNVKTGKVVKFISATKLFSGAPDIGAIALNAKGTQAMVVNSTFPDAPHLGTVRVVNTKTYKLGKRVTTGAEPLSIAVDKVRGKAYTANYADDTVSYFSTPK